MVIVPSRTGTDYGNRDDADGYSTAGAPHGTAIRFVAPFRGSNLGSMRAGYPRMDDRLSHCCERDFRVSGR